MFHVIVQRFEVPRKVLLDAATRAACCIRFHSWKPLRRFGVLHGFHSGRRFERNVFIAFRFLHALVLYGDTLTRAENLKAKGSEDLRDAWFAEEYSFERFSKLGLFVLV